MTSQVSHCWPLAALAVLLLLAGYEDVRVREIADWKNAGIALLAPLWWWSSGLTLWPGVAAQCVQAAVVLLLFALAFHRGWMGGGDVKLLAALALWLPLGAFAAMLVAMSLAGGVLTLLMLADHHWRRRTRPLEIPYGVAIAFAALLAIREPILNQLA